MSSPTNTDALDDSYVEERDGWYYLRDRRLLLSQVIRPWQEGQLPDTIARDFDGITAAQVYGAIACYLSQRPLFDAYFAHEKARLDALFAEGQAHHSPQVVALLDRFDALRNHEASSAS